MATRDGQNIPLGQSNSKGHIGFDKTLKGHIFVCPFNVT